MQGADVKRRRLRFNTIDEALAEARRVADADTRGTLRSSGEWTAGKAMHHLAEFARFAFEGFPFPPAPSEVVANMRGVLLNTIIPGEMPMGIRIPGVPQGTFAIEDKPTPTALKSLATQLGRLKLESPKDAHPLFGPLTHDQWIALNLRHAELHLGLLHP